MSESTQLTEFIKELDGSIRSGQSRYARKKLEELFRQSPMAGIPREFLLPLAALCRRSGIPQKGVALLNPVVRPKARSPRAATASEQTEYAGSLVQIGGVEEGLQLLSTVDAAKTPDTHLFAAFARMGQWNYPAAAAHLERYVAHPDLAPYACLVGRLNLGAALAGSERYSVARTHLETLAEETRREKLDLLTANAGLLLAQVELEQGDWEKAQAHLEEARRLSKEVASVDRLLIEKWLAILALRRDGVTAETLRGLDEVRSSAVPARSFETLRDCDYHLARITGDVKLLRHIYFGTPYAKYRERIARHLDALPNEYEWRLGDRSPHLLDLRSEELKSGQVLWKLANALSSDFYRPQRIASLYGSIFPNQHFNPISSPWAVHQAIQRLRRHLRSRRTPLRIENRGLGAFAFGVGKRSGATIVVRRENSSSPKLDDLLAKLKERGTLIQRSDAEKAWNVSQRSANSFLVSLCEAGRIRRVGAGPQTRYEIISA